MIVPSIDIVDGSAVQLVGGEELAIDAGDPGFLPPPEFDQRGAPFARVVGAARPRPVVNIMTL